MAIAFPMGKLVPSPYDFHNGDFLTAFIKFKGSPWLQPVCRRFFNKESCPCEARCVPLDRRFIKL